MELKIRIRTPKGQAAKAEKKIRAFILGFKKPDSVFVNEDDTEIIWAMQGSVRKIMKIQKNVSKFNSTMGILIQNKHIKKLADKKGDIDTLKEMTEATTIEVIKQATQQEIDDNGKSWFQRIKETFRSVPEEDT